MSDATPDIRVAAHDEAVLSDEPKLEQRWGWGIAFAFFVIALGFAAFVRLDAAVYAPGSIAVSGNRQAVQHRDGGTIAALHVREGQRVASGDVLIELVPAEVGAEAASLRSQMIALEAQRARLIAEYRGLATVPRPEAFAALAPEEQAEAQAALSRQQVELVARRSTVSRQKNVLDQRSAQLTQQIAGLKGQQAATEEQRRLISQELQGIRSLADRGFASQTQVRALERNEAALTGQQVSQASGQAQAQGQIAETSQQAAGLDSEYIERATRELREVESLLAGVKPRYFSMKERLGGASIRAPASGEVVGLAVHTVGGVIAPGQTVLEIVPDAAPLVVEAQVSPVDADDIRVGQAAKVRVVALRDQNIPTLNGTVTRVSADRMTDEESGASYYTAQVTVSAEEFGRIQAVKGADTKLRAGLPVEVLAPLRKRTALEYITEPLTGVFWRAFREH